MSRADTIFSLRYAVRVHERRAKLWESLDAIIRVLSLLSGSAAIAAIAAQNTLISLIFGAVFALIQALEYGIVPTSKAAESKSGRKFYSSILSNKVKYSDSELEQAYEAACDSDDIIVGDLIKEIAYNDATQEIGADSAYLYQLSQLQKIIKWLS